MHPFDVNFENWFSRKIEFTEAFLRALSFLNIFLFRHHWSRNTADDIAGTEDRGRSFKAARRSVDQSLGYFDDIRIFNGRI